MPLNVGKSEGLRILGIILVGGQKEDELAENSTEVFNPKTKKSCKVEALPAPRQAGVQHFIIIRLLLSHLSYLIAEEGSGEV